MSNYTNNAPATAGGGGGEAGQQRQQQQWQPQQQQQHLTWGPDPPMSSPRPAYDGPGCGSAASLLTAGGSSIAPSQSGGLRQRRTLWQKVRDALVHMINPRLKVFGAPLRLAVTIILITVSVTAVITYMLMRDCDTVCGLTLVPLINDKVNPRCQTMIFNNDLPSFTNSDIGDNNITMGVCSYLHTRSCAMDSLEQMDVCLTTLEASFNRDPSFIAKLVQQGPTSWTQLPTLLAGYTNCTVEAFEFTTYTGGSQRLPGDTTTTKALKTVGYFSTFWRLRISTAPYDDIRTLRKHDCKVSDDHTDSCSAVVMEIDYPVGYAYDTFGYSANGSVDISKLAIRFNLDAFVQGLVQFTVIDDLLPEDALGATTTINYDVAAASDGTLKTMMSGYLVHNASLSYVDAAGNVVMNFGQQDYKPTTVAGRIAPTQATATLCHYLQGGASLCINPEVMNSNSDTSSSDTTASLWQSIDPFDSLLVPLTTVYKAASILPLQLQCAVWDVSYSMPTPTSSSSQQQAQAPPPMPFAPPLLSGLGRRQLHASAGTADGRGGRSSDGSDSRSRSHSNARKFGPGARHRLNPVLAVSATTHRGVHSRRTLASAVAGQAAWRDGAAGSQILMSRRPTSPSLGSKVMTRRMRSIEPLQQQPRHEALQRLAAAAAAEQHAHGAPPPPGVLVLEQQHAAGVAELSSLGDVAAAAASPLGSFQTAAPAAATPHAGWQVRGGDGAAVGSRLASSGAPSSSDEGTLTEASSSSSSSRGLQATSKHPPSPPPVPPSVSARIPVCPANMAVAVPLMGARLVNALYIGLAGSEYPGLRQDTGIKRYLQNISQEVILYYDSVNVGPRGLAVEDASDLGFDEEWYEAQISPLNDFLASQGLYCCEDICPSLFTSVGTALGYAAYIEVAAMVLVVVIYVVSHLPMTRRLGLGISDIFAIALGTDVTDDDSKAHPHGSRHQQQHWHPRMQNGASGKSTSLHDAGSDGRAVGAGGRRSDDGSGCGWFQRKRVAPQTPQPDGGLAPKQEAPATAAGLAPPEALVPYGSNTSTERVQYVQQAQQQRYGEPQYVPSGGQMKQQAESAPDGGWIPAVQQGQGQSQQAAAYAAAPGTARQDAEGRHRSPVQLSGAAGGGAGGGGKGTVLEVGAVVVAPRTPAVVATEEEEEEEADVAYEVLPERIPGRSGGSPHSGGSSHGGAGGGDALPGGVGSHHHLPGGEQGAT